jgi:hypothetical protein
MAIAYGRSNAAGGNQFNDSRENHPLHSQLALIWRNYPDRSGVIGFVGVSFIRRKNGRVGFA